MTLVYIALGSNLGTPIENLRKSLEHLSQKMIIKDRSKIYEAKPYGGVKQNNFLNAVILVETNLTAQKLLSVLQNIEIKMGRVRTIHWGARIIDLDILLFGDKVIQKDNLQIPHTELLKRAFVLIPLSDVHPQMLFEKKISEWINLIGDSKDVWLTGESW
ncbi:MAG: 2-amino-4-hydroxy-6-hydroxymethyldihydropteridine diphosphokinase [Streptococcaceae bacterium]|jgi:2-amino-4-hydroxy-6-hydroxymethyldihydropteridine diphosphokinase|nr:2-amino-4-hydroxy-6-hydroxymethyldihydropteridine diphosphokinase [Streptococcaceae bacterium]